MKRIACAVAGLLLAQGALAEQVFDFGGIGRLGIFGFLEEEHSIRTNRSLGLQNCNFTPDPRGVLGTSVAGGPYCRPGQAATSSGDPLHLYALGADVSHEFDSAWKIGGRLTYRARNASADIYGQDFMDKNVAVSHPVFGELRAGTMTSRAWSRSDSFTYPIGLTGPWSESGAGYGLLPKALRYTSPTIELSNGSTLVMELTGATNNVVFAHSAPFKTYNQHPPRPGLVEVFVQYANPSDVIEYVFQASSGGGQSSFSKGAFTGDVGNADNLPNYKKPYENVHILQGEHYFTPEWRGTWGIKRNYWSGEVFQCDFVAGVGCYFPSGFNNGADLIGHAATEYNFLAGVSHFRGLYTYTLGAVRIGKAYTRSPTEFGQSNTASFFNLGVYRRVPEIAREFKIYGGINYVRYGQYGPAPVGLPTELAVSGVDPRDHSSALGLTVGANLSF